LNSDFYLVFLANTACHCKYSLDLAFYTVNPNRGLKAAVELRYCTVSLDIQPRRNEALSTGP